MTIGDLLFIALFLGTVTSLLLSLHATLRGDRGRTRRILRRLGIVVAVYLATLLLVSVVTPRRVLALGEDQCFDDWCIAVDRVSHRPGGKGVSYSVTLRVSSRALRVAQSERGAVVYLQDGNGRTYYPASSADIPLSKRIQPGESFRTVRVFDLPRDARNVGLIVGHGGFPGWFIIGESHSLLHKPTMIALPPPAMSTPSPGDRWSIDAAALCVSACAHGSAFGKLVRYAQRNENFVRVVRWLQATPLMTALEEVSRLLNAYNTAILSSSTPGSSTSISRRDIKGEALG